jgi:hypothetical protein
MALPISKQQQLLEYKMFHEVPQEKMNSQFTVVCKHLVNEHSAQNWMQFTFCTHPLSDFFLAGYTLHIAKKRN